LPQRVQPENAMSHSNKKSSQSVTYFPNTALIGEISNVNQFYLTISLDVDTRIETLVYDVGSFFAAAGGNLGFSCLTCI